MKQFKKYKSVIMAFLGISAFSLNDENKPYLTDEQKAALTNGENNYSATFIEQFNIALGNDFQNNNTSADDQQTDSAITIDQLHATAVALSTTEEELNKSKSSIAQLEQQAMQAQQKLSEAAQDKLALQQIINKLAQSPEEDHGAGAQYQLSMDKQLNLTDTEQLFGQPGVMFSLERPYNERARAALLSHYGYETPLTSSSIDYEGLKQDLGEFHRTKRGEHIISMLQKLPSQESKFPTDSGIIDQQVIPCLFLGEMSQADNSASSSFDSVSKGEYTFEAEKANVENVMFAKKFTNLKEIEKTWIADMFKQDGSSSHKISFIEYLLTKTAIALHTEREKRSIVGIRTSPVKDQPGKAMEASDGIFRFLEKKRLNLQIKPFELPEITAGNILDVVAEGTRLAKKHSEGVFQPACYIPSQHIPMYIAAVRALHGTETDWKGDKMTVFEHQDVKIIPIDYSGDHGRIFWTFEENIRRLEGKPGEMVLFRMILTSFGIEVTSQWKEGIAAQAVGRRWKRAQDMNFKDQYIFMTDKDIPATQFLPMNANTDTPSALYHTSLVSVPNTDQVTITDVLDVKVGQSVILKCGSVDKGIKIVKSGKFSLLSENWTPDEGETIMLMKQASGNFIELHRNVAPNAIILFEPNDTTPNVADAEMFMTSNENTEATTITQFVNAVEGKVFKVYGNGTGANVSTIPANSANIKVRSKADFVTGFWISFVMASNGTFYEVDRKA